MSKYQPLWEHISNCGEERISMTFEEIGKIVGVPINHAFLRYKKELTQYGYQVGKISMKEQKVNFERLPKSENPVRIEHIAMYVNDLENAKNFFVKYFNASSNELYHNEKTNFSSYFLTFGGGARLEIMSKPNVRSDENARERTGYIHISFSLGSKKAVDELTERMSRDGYSVVSGPRTTGDGYYESCIVGFEGSLIEITE